MKKNRILVVLLFLTGFLLTGCLTSEYKEYKFEFTGKNSGKLTIVYKNIMSLKDNEDLTKDEEIKKDFDELINNYIDGNYV